MYIGLFNESFPPIMDGVAVAVENTAIQLANLGYKTEVITPYHPKRDVDTAYDLYQYPSMPIPFRPPYRVGLPFMSISFLKNMHKTGYSIVHAHSPFSAGNIALRKARRDNIPFVATFHSKFKDDFSHAVKNKHIVNAMVKRIVRFFDQADEVWIPQPAVVETLREYGYKGKVEVVPNGVDFSILKSYAEKNSYKQMLGIDADTKLLLFVGQHIYEKNLKLIVDSLALIKRLNFKMFFIGDGYARNELAKLVDSYGLSSNICFTGLVTDRNKLNTYFRAADLFVFPSKYDNAPLVVREAAAARTPSLLLHGSTAAEVITDSYNGFLANEDAKQYADTIVKILSSDTSAVADTAAKTLCISWHDVAIETADRYKQLILRKSHKAMPVPQ